MSEKKPKSTFSSPSAPHSLSNKVRVGTPSKPDNFKTGLGDFMHSNPQSKPAATTDWRKNQLRNKKSSIVFGDDNSAAMNAAATTNGTATKKPAGKKLGSTAASSSTSNIFPTPSSCTTTAADSAAEDMAVLSITGMGGGKKRGLVRSSSSHDVIFGSSGIGGETLKSFSSSPPRRSKNPIVHDEEDEGIAVDFSPRSTSASKQNSSQIFSTEPLKEMRRNPKRMFEKNSFQSSISFGGESVLQSTPVRQSSRHHESSIVFGGASGPSSEPAVGEISSKPNRPSKGAMRTQSVSQMSDIAGTNHF